MGWCSGTILFDDILSILFDPKATEFNSILKRIITTLEDMDWDCQMDSVYWNKPVVQAAFRELHPEWFEDE